MRTPEARPASSQEAGIVHSPVIDSVRQGLSSEGAFIVRESVTTRELDNPLSISKVLQLVEFYTAPRAYDYKTGSKEEYANNIVVISRDLIRDLTRYVNNLHEKAIHYSTYTVWPVKQGTRIGNGVFFFDEILGQERTDSKVRTIETRRGSLRELGVKPGVSRRYGSSALVRRITIDVYPHPLLALVAPRITERGLGTRIGSGPECIGPEVTVDLLADIQRNRSNSRIALVALERGLVTQQELEQIFSRGA